MNIIDNPMKSVAQIQSEIKEWSNRNFGKNISKVTGQELGSIAPLLGIMEEVGELTHCVLKRHQGIRGYDKDEKYIPERNDAIADIGVYLCDFCQREGVSFHEMLAMTWEAVKLRDWEKNKGNAHEVAEQSK